MKRWTLPLLLGLLVTMVMARAGGAGTNPAAAPPAADTKPVYPADLPARLPGVEAPRNWGDTFLPKSKSPARTVLAVPMAGRRNDERVALTCLQGLLAREQPRLWLVRNKEDSFWIEWHRAKGHMERFETVTNWAALFQQFRGAAKGAVIPDDQLFPGDLRAVIDQVDHLTNN